MAGFLVMKAKALLYLDSCLGVSCRLASLAATFDCHTNCSHWMVVVGVTVTGSGTPIVVLEKESG